MADLQVAKHQAPASALCVEYDWSTHQSHLRDVARSGLLPPDTGWSVEAACGVSQPADFADVCRDLDRIRASAADVGKSEDITVPRRIATVVVWNLKREDLDYANRCGAAWSVIPTGFVAHKWRFRNDLARVLIYRARLDFFDRHGDVDGLTTLLEACFYDPETVLFKQNARMRALLDRKELAALKREVERVAPVPPDSPKHTKLSRRRR